MSNPSTATDPGAPSGEPSSGLCIQSLRVRHQPGGRLVLDDVRLQIPAGQTLVLLGHSGCGKSTLLHAIAGLIEPVAGTIRIAGVDQAGVAPHRRPVSLLFQNDALYPHLCVAENLRLPLAGRLPRGRGEDRWRSAARAAGVSDLLTRAPATLSGGQRRRVALAKSFAIPAAVRMLDEPTSAIDASHRQTLISSLRRWEAEQPEFVAGPRPATLLVTHDGEEAMRWGDRIAVLQGGRMVQIGTAEQLHRDPATVVVAESIGTPPINLAAGRGGGTIGVRPQRLRMSLEPPQADAAIRQQRVVDSVHWVNNRLWWTIRSDDAAQRDWIAVTDPPPPQWLHPGQRVWCHAEAESVLRWPHEFAAEFAAENPQSTAGEPELIAGDTNPASRRV